MDRRRRGAARRRHARRVRRPARRSAGARASPTWGQDGARIARLRGAAEFAIYTPGSRAGLPVSILSSFAAPRGAARDDAEALAERAGSTATERAVAGRRRGRAAQPRAHAPVDALRRRLARGPGSRSRLADPAGADAALPEGRRRRSRVVLPVEGALRAGDAVQRPAGRARVRAVARRRAARPGDAALYAPRASRASRSSRSRTSATRSGCSSCRCCSTRWSPGCAPRPAPRACARSSTWTRSFGYFPPVANPPSKAPLLTLLKQGRAFGLGVVLATQNPVDLDYKGLANIGHLVPRPAADRARQGAHARRSRRRGRRHARSRDGRPAALGARQARVPPAQRPRQRPHACSRRAGRCRTCADRCPAIRFASSRAMPDLRPQPRRRRRPQPGRRGSPAPSL